MKTKPLCAALDLRCTTRVLGSMDQDGNNQPRVRFATSGEKLKEAVTCLGSKQRRAVHLTLEAGPLARWAAGIVGPLAERLVICDFAP